MDRAALVAAMQQAAASAVVPRPVTVPVWGTVYVRDVTVAEVSNEAPAAADDGQSGKKSNLARGACRVLCDENGQRLFDASKAEDIELLSAQPWSLLQKVLAAADSTGNP